MAVTPGVPYFPVIVPPATVIGRLSSGAGPAEAIPFSMLGSLLGAATYLIAASISGINTVTGLTVSGTNVATPLSANQIVEFVPAANNTGATTFNRDGLGAVPILSNGAALVGGELIAGIPIALFYDGANYRIVGGGFIQSGTGAVVRTVQAKERDIVNMADFSTPQQFFNYVTANNMEGEINAGDYTLTSSITISSASQFKIRGRSSSGGLFSAGVRFLWGGASGGTVFSLSNTRDYELGNFTIIPSGSNTIGVGIDVDGASTTWGRHSNIAIYKGATGTLTTGVRFGNTSVSGCDLSRWDNLFIQDAATGISIINGQSKWHAFYNATLARCSVAGIATTAGSFSLYHPNLSANAIDISLGTVTDVINIYSPQSETAGRYISQTGAVSNGWAVNTHGGRISNDGLNGDGKFIICNAAGPMNFFGTDFACGTANSSWRIASNNQTGVNFGTGNPNINAYGVIFPNSTVIDIPSVSNASVALHGCRYVSAGSAIALPSPYFLNETSLIPNTQTGATYTVAIGDKEIIANRAGTVTLTLPDATKFGGRSITVKTIQNQTVVSDASNVVPQIGGSAGTAILAGTAGKWARLVSDQVTWVIMESN